MTHKLTHEHVEEHYTKAKDKVEKHHCDLKCDAEKLYESTKKYK